MKSHWVAVGLRRRKDESNVRLVSFKNNTYEDPNIVLTEGINAVCEYFHCTQEDVFKDTRKMQYVMYRVALYSYMRGRGLTLSAIAKSTNCDHSTVIHHLRKNAYKDTRNPIRSQNPIIEFLETYNIYYYE